ncbi:MAG: methyltransferase domain-containing protein [Caldilineaceae bacterium]|nr:methyltransferase domain-containing protein [Caldilineaceae bacterium]
MLSLNNQPPWQAKTEFMEFQAKLGGNLKAYTYEVMRVQPGHRVLDVGCGPGIDTCGLAQRVGPTGQVVGVDRDEQTLADADQRAQEKGVAGWVEHRLADAEALPFADNTFDGCRAERVFMHQPHPEKVLAEMVRVLKPGGWVVVLEGDGETISFDLDDLRIHHILKRAWIEKHSNSYAGRKLYRQFKQRGLLDVTVEQIPFGITDLAVARRLANLDDLGKRALAAGWFTEEELRGVRTRMEEADAEGVFFCQVIQNLVSGNKAEV